MLDQKIGLEKNLKYKVIEEKTHICPNCKPMGSERLWDSLIKRFRPKTIGHESAIIFNFEGENKEFISLYMDACKRCGAFYCYKYTVEVLEEVK